MVSAAYFTIGDDTHCSKLRDSVIGTNTQTLDDFACQVVARFGSRRALVGRSVVAHIALLVSMTLLCRW
jgi:hypothetical protein